MSELWTPPPKRTLTCARCGTERGPLDMATIYNGEHKGHYCHPGDSSGVTCYMLAVGENMLPHLPLEETQTDG